MSLLQQVQRGRSHLPPRILVYGTEGVGKSSLAATTPKPIFIQTEDGLGEIDCDKFPLAKSLEDGATARKSNEGTVDECKREIVNLLEGGENAFKVRKCRYAY